MFFFGGHCSCVSSGSLENHSYHFWMMGVNRSWVKIGFFSGFNILCNGYSFLIWGYFLSAGRALDDGTCHGTAECHSVEKPGSYGLWKKTRVDYAQGGPIIYQF